MIDEMEKEMVESFKDMERMMPKDMIREFRDPNGSVRKEYGPFVYGYSVRIGPDGRPIIREFGNMKPGISGEGKPHLDLQDQREPLVDIVDEADRVKVLAELPGVEKEDIKLYATPNTLTINVDTPQKKYFKELELPSEVDETSAKSTYRNGILETILDKKRQSRKGKEIPIE